MECKHKESKGRQGPMRKHEYQHKTLHQCGLSVLIRIENHRKIIETQFLRQRNVCTELTLNEETGLCAEKHLVTTA